MKDLSLHVMDILQNSIAAEADTIEINIGVNITEDVLSIKIIDNGRGMDSEFLKSVSSPFITTRTTRSVGLGIPLLKMLCDMAEGNFVIESEVNKGTIVLATFKINHVDRLPLGDIPETIMTIISAYPNLKELVMVLNCNDNKNFVFKLSEIKKAIGSVSINNIDVLIWIKEYLAEQILIIFGGVLSEINC